MHIKHWFRKWGIVLALGAVNVSAIAVAAGHECDTWKEYSFKCDCCLEQPPPEEVEGEDKEGNVTRIRRTPPCKRWGKGWRVYDGCAHGYKKNDTGCGSCSDS